MTNPVASGAVPFLFYDDLAGSIEWLKEVFGLSERFRLATPQGFVAHAELEINGGIVMVGNVGPRNAGPQPELVRSAVYVFVEDLDAHFKSARSAGAEILEEPEEQPYGDRTYCAKDLEGHESYFSQHLRDVSISDLMRGFQ